MATSAPVAAGAEIDTLNFAPSYLPNYAILSLGSVPDYIGSDETFIGPGPAVRRSFGSRYIDLTVTYLSINLIDHPNWQAGPAAQYRFGRSDVQDPVVATLPDIDPTIEMGGFLGYTGQLSQDPRDRWRIGASITADVAGRHDGHVVAATALRWLPLGDFAVLGLAAAGSYGSGNYTDTYFSVTPDGAAASGLPVFAAGAGLRDLRAMAMVVQPLSPQWAVGAGAMYSRIMGDAADSPLVRDRGSADQWVLGFGLARMF